MPAVRTGNRHETPASRRIQPIEPIVAEMDIDSRRELTPFHPRIASNDWESLEGSQTNDFLDLCEALFGDDQGVLLPHFAAEQFQ